MPDEQYVGYDPNARYIARARAALKKPETIFVSRFGRAKADRMGPGKNVRMISGCRTLVSRQFDTIHETLIHNKFLPYTLFVTECS
jgi:hypothetical protein